MNILIAPASFKGSLSSAEAAQAMDAGVTRAARSLGIDIQTDLLPIADGGAGTVDAALSASDASRRLTAPCHGPTGADVEAVWAMLPADAAPPTIDADGATIGVLECASVAGLSQTAPAQRDPERASTAGLGDLIAAAAGAGCGVIIVGLGDSATVDGGVGMAAALGVQFFDSSDAPIERPTGADLARIARIDAGGLRVRTNAVIRIIAACDVNNPLLGERGAARVFGPQKGASPEQVQRLERGLANLVARCAEASLDADPEAPGAGAAGGLGFGLRAILGAELRPGAELTLELVRFGDHAAKADLVLTGEGRLDSQSMSGKAPIAAANLALEAGIPTIALVGAVGDGWRSSLRSEGGPLSDVRTITPENMDPQRALREAGALLEQAASEAVAARLVTG